MSDTLSTLRALEAAATPGPWITHKGYDYHIEPNLHHDSEDVGWVFGTPDLDLTIAARNALPALLRVAEAARALYEAMDDSMMTEPRPAGEHAARFVLAAALAALEEVAS